jgi:hypothetical protein
MVLFSLKFHAFYSKKSSHHHKNGAKAERHQQGSGLSQWATRELRVRA